MNFPYLVPQFTAFIVHNVLTYLCLNADTRFLSPKYISSLKSLIYFSTLLLTNSIIEIKLLEIEVFYEDIQQRSPFESVSSLPQRDLADLSLRSAS